MGEIPSSPNLESPLDTEVDPKALRDIVQGFFVNSSDEEQAKLRPFYEMLEAGDGFTIPAELSDKTLDVITQQLGAALLVEDEELRIAALLQIAESLERIYPKSN